MSTQENVREVAGEVDGSEALRMDAEKAEQIIDALNADLADAYVLYHQLKKHHWNVEGAEFRDLHLFLGEAAGNVEEAADKLAERAQALGGTPVASMGNLQDHATAEMLREGLVTIEDDAHHVEHYLEEDTLVTADAVEK